MADKVGSLIERTLKPLVEEREGLLEEYTQLKQAADEKQAEIKTVEKLLRAGGLLEPPTKPPPKKTAGASETTCEKLLLAAAQISNGGSPFSQSELSRASGVGLDQTKAGLETLRLQGRMRLVGKRPGKKGRPATHWALI